MGTSESAFKLKLKAMFIFYSFDLLKCFGSQSPKKSVGVFPFSLAIKNFKTNWKYR